MPTVAEALLEQLQMWGVKRVYGVVGDAILGLIDAISKQDEIKFYAVKHESTAAMMASAHAKLTGEIGVCISTMGPGMANLLNGLGDAWQDQSSVLAITGQAPAAKIGTDFKQYVNQQELIKPFATYSTLLAHPDAIVDVTLKAMHTSLTQGAVSHLSIPKDMFDQQTSGKPQKRPELLKGTAQFDKQGIQRAADMMQNAQRPMILAGLGARDAASSIEKLATAWGAGLLLSLGAKGMIADNSPQLLGGIGEGGNPYAAEVFKQADVVLLAGDTWWPSGYVPTSATVIQIDTIEQNIGKGIPVELGIVGQTENVAPLLADALAGHQVNQEWLSQCQQAKQKWDSENEQEGQKSGSPIYPARVVRGLQKSVSDNAIITIDTGDVTVWMNRSFQQSRQQFLFSGDWRTMGFGLPAAMAAKLAYPDRQVVAAVGDGGLAMVLADLLTAVRYELDITVVVFNNGALQMEKDKMMVGDYATLGADNTNPDFVKLAEACGVQGYKIETDTDLEPILQQALASGKPSLVEVITDAVVFPEAKAK